MDSIWRDMTILGNRKGHISKLQEIAARSESTYGELSGHLEKISGASARPSEMATLVTLCEQFDNLKTETDRTLLNLFIYINNIKVNHLNCHLDTHHMEKIATLLAIISEQRGCLASADYVDYMEHLNDQKDKSPDNYYPFLALMEKRTIKKMLNGCMVIKMITNYIIKHLEKYDTLETNETNLQSKMNMYM
jgi:hypothetical protein